MIFPARCASVCQKLGSPGSEWVTSAQAYGSFLPEVRRFRGDGVVFHSVGFQTMKPAEFGSAIAARAPNKSPERQARPEGEQRPRPPETRLGSAPQQERVQRPWQLPPPVRMEPLG